MFSGKLVQAVLHKAVVLPTLSVTNATLYNGAAATAASGTGLDTLSYDDVNFVLSSGSFGTTANLAVSIYENSVDNGVTATAIPTSSFTAVTTANHQGIQVGSITARDHKRYLWAVSVQTGSATTQFGITAVLGQADLVAVSNSPVFDLTGDASPSQAL